MLGTYILKGKVPTPCEDSIAWAKAFGIDNRRVASTTIGESRVSTVFLGIDHSYGDGPPLLFETMVFEGPLDQEQDRCSTWEQAEAMHAEMCAKVRHSLGCAPQSQQPRRNLMKIPTDKQLHFAAGTVAGIAVAILTRTWWAPLVAAHLLGDAKEAWDQFHPGHTVDFWDAMATAAGGVLPALAVLLLHH